MPLADLPVEAALPDTYLWSICCIHSFSDEAITDEVSFPPGTLLSWGWRCRSARKHLPPLAVFPFSPPRAEAHCSGAELSLDGSKSGCLCIRDCVILSKGKIPRTKQYYGAIWIVFYGFSEAFCPLPKTVKAVLEALKRYFSIVIDHFLGLKMIMRGTGEHMLQHILLTQTSRNQQSSKEDKKIKWTSVPRIGSRSDVGWTCQDLNLTQPASLKNSG